MKKIRVDITLSHEHITLNRDFYIAVANETSLDKLMSVITKKVEEVRKK